MKIISRDDDNTLCRWFFLSTLVLFVIGLIIHLLFPMIPTETGRNVRIITAIIWIFSYLIGLPLSYSSIPKNYDILNISIAYLIGVLLLLSFIGGALIGFNS